MTRQALVDTDVLSTIMRGQGRVIYRARDYLRIHSRLSFSVVTAYEVMRGLKSKGSVNPVADFLDFCQTSDVILLTIEIAEIAATIHHDLKQRGEILDDADILIAATAIAKDFTLVTNNLRHFSRIERLTVDRWQ